MEYLLEAMDDAERWYAVGRYVRGGIALDSMSDFHLRFPRVPARVLTNPGRRVVVLHDPRPEDL